MPADLFPFVRSFMKSARAVGAIAPSGRQLADVITSEISRSVAPVIELGPGTGVFTRAMLDRGLEQEDIALIEYGSDFVRHLQIRFPNTHIQWMDAGWLSRVELFGHGKTGAVVSGLPLLAMPPKKVMQILDGAFTHLRPGGVFYQFTYAPVCPIPRAILDRMGLKATRFGGACSNLPPAAVYRIRRRPAGMLSRNGPVARLVDGVAG
ncbi:hypothetical protein GJW-30_1_00278 [Variibacter gotjawalensis]|uniref:16S ribosomal RNA methyltransferase KsgA/Dim1 family protein n=1 Tax=Variibacter gotjawalensis TaxID=1333996 RepID=A0A0S3PP97_9BRAD|nr:hypothetical protein [Variibacter gotjawalensis]NIK48065.1 phospholipid N-methyltransferase [Variibacter gotjawalensis]RZS49941.1 phospholipid N-methyltransferase [Variibacter gotjawalensis]BAT57768.1 hypothetical protein GJW-30_1_00278 [Variibacter gotjawalensis]